LSWEGGAPEPRPAGRTGALPEAAGGRDEGVDVLVDDRPVLGLAGVVVLLFLLMVAAPEEGAAEEGPLPLPDGRAGVPPGAVEAGVEGGGAEEEAVLLVEDGVPADEDPWVEALGVLAEGREEADAGPPLPTGVGGAEEEPPWSKRALVISVIALSVLERRAVSRSTKIRGMCIITTACWRMT